MTLNCNLEIYHIFHSGTAVSQNNQLFIFDFYRARNDDKIIDVFPHFAEYDNVFVFVSHGHFDHYSKEIFDWFNINENITCILSQDVSLPPNIESEVEEKVFQLPPVQQIQVKNIFVKTLGSTDRGVSFLTGNSSLHIFHSGDLNWWHWKSFSESKLAAEEEKFKKEIDRLKKMKLEVDIAFVPVDPRLEEYFYLAGEYFIEQIEPKILVPIHFDNNFGIVEEFKNHINSSSVKIPSIPKEKYQVVPEN